MEGKKPELLSPAGSYEALETAAYFGADAVYCGGPMLQMRARSTGLTFGELKAGAGLLHSAGKKLYVTVNCLAYDDEIDALPGYMDRLRETGADAVIVSDLGALETIRSCAPDMDIHVSTQANCLNSRTAAAYGALGASRVVLAREMTVSRIRQLHERLGEKPELEVFVHGAMCMAYSGRCLISAFLTGRSGNRGECTQPCRWNYSLVEEKRPGVFIPVEEQDGLTEILSSHDLCCIDMLDELAGAGAVSFKIEGRMKTAYYTATVTDAYRRRLDGTADSAMCRQELDCASHRPFSEGFYHGREKLSPTNNGQYFSTCRFAAKVTDALSGGVFIIEQRNRFGTGDRLEILSPSSFGQSFIVPVMKDSSGAARYDAYLPGEKLTIETDAPLHRGDMLRSEASQ